MDNSSQRRYNILLGEWVVVCKDRLNRPWKGETSRPNDKPAPTETCLSPGVIRPNGKQIPLYSGTYVFENDFPVFCKRGSGTAASDDKVTDEDGLFIHHKTYGINKVICYSSDSSKTQATLNQEQNENVVRAFINEIRELKNDYEWIQIFENHGAAVGCSVPHPHCQLWGTCYLPTNAEKRNVNQKKYFDKTASVMLLDYLKKEREKKERIVLTNDHWTVLVPYWAYWPYETILIPHRHIKRLDELDDNEISSLAQITKKLLIKYDNLFMCDFPFMFGWHGAPTGSYLNSNMDHWQLHAVYYPPLLRSANVKKFLAGYESMCEPQRDFSPEKAAHVLGKLEDTIHYTATE